MITRVDPIRSAQAVTATEFRTLGCVAAMMIPASAEYDVPGADDAAILADIARSLGRDTVDVRKALGLLDHLAGGSLADAAGQIQEDAIQRFRQAHPALATVLVAVITRCYYRDDRVMRSLGMEVRPPFPKGFDVEQGDWSLLDPVRARGKIYREVA